MIQIGRRLPGELEGEIKPEDYRFDFLNEPLPLAGEVALRIVALYEQAKERTGVAIPKAREICRFCPRGAVL